MKTIEGLVTQMQLARQGILTAHLDWPHPSAREMIAPVRTLTTADVQRAKDDAARRGVSQITISRAILIAYGSGYSRAETIDFLDELVEIDAA